MPQLRKQLFARGNRHFPIDVSHVKADGVVRFAINLDDILHGLALEHQSADDGFLSRQIEMGLEMAVIGGQKIIILGKADTKAVRCGRKPDPLALHGDHRVTLSVVDPERGVVLRVVADEIAEPGLVGLADEGKSLIEEREPTGTIAKAHKILVIPQCLLVDVANHACMPTRGKPSGQK